MCIPETCDRSFGEALRFEIERDVDRASHAEYDDRKFFSQMVRGITEGDEGLQRDGCWISKTPATATHIKARKGKAGWRRNYVTRIEDTKSNPVRSASPCRSMTTRGRCAFTSPLLIGRLQDRLLENPLYKNNADALKAGLQWGREIVMVRSRSRSLLESPILTRWSGRELFSSKEERSAKSAIGQTEDDPIGMNELRKFNPFALAVARWNGKKGEHGSLDSYPSPFNCDNEGADKCMETSRRTKVYVNGGLMIGRGRSSDDLECVSS